MLKTLLVQMLAWVSFTLMTQCAPAGIFTLAGAYQMIVWALGKHKNYRTEFKVRSCTWCTLSGTKSLTISGLSDEKKGSHSIHTLKRNTQKSTLPTNLV